MGCSSFTEITTAVVVKNYNYRADKTFTFNERKCIDKYLIVLSSIMKTVIVITYDLEHPDNADDGGSFNLNKIIIRTNGTGGVFSLPERIIRVGTSGRAKDNPKLVALVVVHEFGHDFGMDHVLDEFSLMSPIMNGDGTLIWTKYDQTECERVNACSLTDGGFNSFVDLTINCIN